MPMRCRHCENNLEAEIIDLGNQPPSNRYLSFDEIDKNETFIL